MNRYQYLALPAYLTAFALIVIPFTDASLTLYPWRFGTAQWRFGAVGLFSNAFMIPSAGMLILLATAATLGHWRTLKVFGVVCALGALATLLGIGTFALDAIQSSANVVPAAKLSFKVASFTAAAKLLIAAITMVAFAIMALRTKSEKHRPATAGVQVVTPKPRAEALV